MAVFTYRAMVVGSAKPLGGTIAADTPRSARDMLRQRGLTVLDIQAARPATSRGLWGRLGRIRSGEMMYFTRELATLLSVGVPIAEALATVGRQARGRLRVGIEQLQEDVSAGLSLAEAMRRRPMMFDQLAVHLTAVGEDSGHLETTLTHLADFQDRAVQFRGKLGSALLYPAIVLLLAIGVSVFLMTYVVPQLLEGLAETGRAIPWPTRVVMGISTLLLEWGWAIAPTVVGVLLAAVMILSIPRFKPTWHRILLRLPVIGAFLVKQQTARLAFVLSILLKSGIMFNRAMDIVEQATPNRAMGQALGRANRAVLAGRPIADSLEQAGLFPPTTIHVFSIGEQSGRLEELLDRLAEDYNRQITAATTRLTTALEPILIIVLVGFVGLIAFATILPMLEVGHVL